MSFISPVQHSVPAGNDYKNININNFKGTNTSDNLFDGKSSGCSESENVYINEQNILAVRPRLQHETSFENVTDILQVDSVGPDEMVYYLRKDDDTYHILISNKSNPGKQTGDVCISVTTDLSKINADPIKCRFFRDGDGKLIWVTKNGLYEIYEKDDEGNKVWTYRQINEAHPDIYIPKTRIGMTFGNDLSGLETGETPNILGDKYERLYNYSLDFLEEIPKNYVEGKTWKIDDIIKINAVMPKDENGNYKPDDALQIAQKYSPGSYWFGDTDKFYEINPRAISKDSNNKDIPNYKQGFYNGQQLYFNGIYTTGSTNILLRTTKWWNSVNYKTGDYYYVDENWISSQSTLLIPKTTGNSTSWVFMTPQPNYGDTTNIKYCFLTFYKESLKNQKATVRVEFRDSVTENSELHRKVINLTPTAMNWNFEAEADFISGEIAMCNDDTNVYITLFVTSTAETYDKNTIYTLAATVPIVDILEDSTEEIDISTTQWTELSMNSRSVYITDQYQTDTDVYVVVADAYSSGGDVDQDSKLRSFTIRPHVIKVNKQSNEVTSLFDNYISFQTVNGSPSCKLLPITDTKFLIVLTNDQSVTSKLQSPTFHNIRLYDSEILCSSKQAVIVDVANKTVTYVLDDRLENKTLYKIPESTSFLAINNQLQGVSTIEDDATLNVSIDVFTNYTNQESGSFHIYDTEETWDDGTDLQLKDRKHSIFVRKEDDKFVVYAIADDDSYTPSSGSLTPLDFYELYTFTTEIDDTVKNLTRVVEKKFENSMDYTDVTMLDNRLWFFGSDTNPNKVQWTLNTSAFYVPEDFYTTVGKYEPITNITALSTDVLGVFQANTTTVLMEDENGYYSRQRTLKTPKGCVGSNQVVIIPTTNYPLVINDDSVAVLMQSGNGVVEDSMFSILTEDIFEKFALIKDKQNIKTHVHGYYVYLYWVEDKQTNIWCLDCRTNSWFKWTLPIEVKFMYETETTINEGSETETRLVTDTDEYTLTSDLYIQEGSDDSEFNEDIEAYLDYLGNRTYRRIPWKWKSRIQTLGTTNYLKKIVSLQLMFSDKVRKQKEDGVFTKNNSMFFTIKTYRKKSKLLNGSFTSHLDGVGIQRIKVRLQKCDFAEIILSNYNEDAGQLDHVNMFSNGDMILLDNESDKFMCSEENFIYNTFDRLHLIGIMLKVLLSEGLNG